MQDERAPLLPEAASQPAPAEESNLREPVWRRRAPRTVALLVSLAIAALALYTLAERSETSSSLGPLSDFYHNVNFVGNDICPSVWGNTSSHAGYIGLEDGGPGSSGLASPMMSSAPCIVGEDGFEPSVHHYTAKYNLVALDHPIGVGFSYGIHVSNSTKAAKDAYDFLQKLYVLFPHLADNKVILMSSSYGGVFVPWISEIIREQNRLVDEGRGVLGAVHVNLDSLVIGNPFTDPLAHYRWDLHYRCEISRIYNNTTCRELYGVLPSCLESIELALQDSTDMSSRAHAEEICRSLVTGDTNHTMVMNVKHKCMSENELDCVPVYAKMNSTLNSARIKKALGVPEHVAFLGYSLQVAEEFKGDTMYSHEKLLQPLITEGIRVLIHAGMLDANCNNLGVFSFLKLLRTPYQADFLAAADISWIYEGEKAGTFRTAGPLTYLTIDDSGHILVADQPAYARWIVERWIEGKGFA